MTPGRFSQVAAIALVIVAGGVTVWKLTTQPTPPPATTTKPLASPPPSSTTETVTVVATRSGATSGPERLVGEIRYLPESLQVPKGKSSLLPPGFTKGSRRVTDARPLTNKEKDGDFISPRWSPDGLSILVSRPGFQGIYILDPNTGEIRKIAGDNGYRAEWTADGRIAVSGDDGTKYYNADGSPAEEGSQDSANLAWAENDMIYVVGKNGETVPVTGTDDRYFNPQTSPDGKYLVYQGLVNGLYMVALDGSSAPQWIGRGSNPSWLPDGSGIVFDQTTDDGHHLNSGQLMLLDLGGNQISNLTADDPAINQMPQVSPNGKTIIYETEGQILVGTLR